MKLITLIFGLFLAPTLFAYNNVKDFDDNQSKLKVLVFLSSSCPCSRSHVEHLNTLNDKYKNVQLYGVITDVINTENKELVHNYYKDQGFSFPVIKDEQQVLIKRYKALKTPHSVILKKGLNGKEYDLLYEGGVSDHRFFDSSSKHYLQENLESLHSTNSIKYEKGISLGCYIRRL